MCSLKDSLIVVALGSCALASNAAAESAFADRPPMREAPTNEQLVLQLRKDQQEQARRPAVPATPSQDASKLEAPGSLLDRSEILCFGGCLALVPKRSVLQYPEKYADRLKAVPGASVLAFSDFYAENTSWITTFEVSRAQAQGREPLAKDARVQMSKTGNLIVATFHGNPIELLPPVNPEPATVGNAPKSTIPQP